MNKRGWGFPGLSRKAHYFISGMSLCNKWWFTGELDDSQDNHPDNCKECQKRKAKIDNKEKSK